MQNQSLRRGTIHESSVCYKTSQYMEGKTYKYYDTYTDNIGKTEPISKEKCLWKKSASRKIVVKSYPFLGLAICKIKQQFIKQSVNYEIQSRGKKIPMYQQFRELLKWPCQTLSTWKGIYGWEHDGTHNSQLK